MQGRSTLPQLLTFLNHILKAQNQTDVIYLNISKVFDSIPHNELLVKLHKLGFRGKLLSWFQNYLTNRDQKVRINNSLLISKPVISGVPQGSILGPMFFIIYMNNLPSCVSNTESLLFVDDTKCFCNVSHPSDVTMLQNDLYSVVSWSKAWGLNFNPSKSIHLSFKSKINSTYHILGSPITSQLSYKDLGVIIFI